MLDPLLLSCPATRFSSSVPSGTPSIDPDSTCQLVQHLTRFFGVRFSRDKRIHRCVTNVKRLSTFESHNFFTTKKKIKVEVLSSFDLSFVRPLMLSFPTRFCPTLLLVPGPPSDLPLPSPPELRSRVCSSGGPLRVCVTSGTGAAGREEWVFVLAPES